MNGKYTKSILAQSSNIKNYSIVKTKGGVSSNSNNHRIIETSLPVKYSSSLNASTNSPPSHLGGRRNLKQWLTDDNYVKNIVLK